MNMLQHGSFPGYAGAGSRGVNLIPMIPAIPVYLQMLGTFGRRQAGEAKRYSNSTGPVIRISSVSNRS